MIQTRIINIIKENIKSYNTPIAIEVFNSKEHGDFSSNVAFKIASALKVPPLKIARELAEKLRAHKNFFRKVEVAGNGFINFWVVDNFKYDLIKKILEDGDNYGRGKSDKYYNVEYVSANPTGFLHIGHARGGVIGDVLSNILEFAGVKVDREYVVNDTGAQIAMLGLSTYARYQQLFDPSAPFPKDGYQGAEIITVAKDIKKEVGSKYYKKPYEPLKDWFEMFAKTTLLETIKDHLAQLGVVIQIYYPESRSHENNAITDMLEKIPYKYEKDGAYWLKTTAFGDDKDRVLVKSDKTYTYFTGDVTYHLIKARRGYDKLINVWGADHSGFIKRMQTALELFGYKDYLDIVVVQMVRLISGNKEVKMSKRSGTSYTLLDLVQEVGPDIARFLLLERTPDSRMDFNLEVAKSLNHNNPVYYIQYAYARTCQLLKKAKFDLKTPIVFKENSLDGKQEQFLIDLLREFPGLITKMIKSYKINLLNHYLLSLAKEFHSFYNNNRVIGSEFEKEKLFLVKAVNQVIKNGLNLLRISTPERMD